MKFVIVVALVAMVGVVAAAPKPETATILKSSHDLNPDDSFTFVSETSDGIYITQQGKQKTPEIYALEGSFSYTADNGQQVKVTYVADENGFRPRTELKAAGQ